MLESTVTAIGDNFLTLSPFLSSKRTLFKFQLDKMDGGYTAWAAGEPNDYRKGGHCLDLDYGKGRAWNDLDCSINAAYLCKRKIGTVVIDKVSSAEYRYTSL